jgi:hypothetical protein
MRPTTPPAQTPQRYGTIRENSWMSLVNTTRQIRVTFFLV